MKMKVILSDSTFSYLFPGGKQVLADRLLQNIRKLGIDIRYENWHDPTLAGDIVHMLGFKDYDKIIALKERGYKLVYTHLLDSLTNLSNTKKLYHLLKNRLILPNAPNKLNPLFPWKALKYFDALIYSHENDRKTAIKYYNVDPDKTHIIPMALDSLDQYVGDGKETSIKYLVCLGSIVPRKNAIFTAKLCKDNSIPIKFIGPYFDKESSYFKEFLSYTENSSVEYLGYLSEADKIDVLKSASGFVMLSHGESGCISVYEAAATGLPLLLSDLPWAKGYEQPIDMTHCSPRNNKLAQKVLIKFYSNSERRDYPTFTVHDWNEISKLYKNVYLDILK